MAIRNRVDLKSAGRIFLIAFVINLVWEYLQYDFYVPIHPLTRTWYTLIGASFLDAFYVLGLLVFFYRFGVGVVLFLALILAGSIEFWALHFQVWKYAEAMPMIPVVNLGLLPAVQLMISSLAIWLGFLKPDSGRSI